MAIAENEIESLFLDKEEIRRIVAEQNAKSGFVPDPAATPQRAGAGRGMSARAGAAAGR